MHGIDEAARSGMELDESRTGVFEHVDHQPGKLAVTEHDTRARLEPAAGLHEALPGVAILLAEKEDLHRPAGLVLGTVQARGEHTRLVDHQHIAGPQIVEHVGEASVVDLAAHPVQDQQPAGVAGLDRVLRDQPARQVVIEIIGPHVSGLSERIPWRQCTAGGPPGDASSRRFIDRHPRPPRRGPRPHGRPSSLPCARPAAPRVRPLPPPGSERTRSSSGGTCRVRENGASPRDSAP